MAYIELPIEDDSQMLSADVFDWIQSQYPGWNPAAGNLETWLIEALSFQASELRALAAQVPSSIFSQWGGEIVGDPALAATAATSTTSWTAIDTLGYTIPAGTELALATSGNELVAFATDEDATIPNGQATLTNIPITAVEEGAQASGLSGEVTLLDSLDYIQVVVLEAPTQGGVDAEDPNAYLDRLSNEMTTMAPRPIVANDFAILSLRIQGVARALALDGYNPANQTSGNEKMVAVALVNALGQPVSSTIKTQVQAMLQAQREVNFVVNVIDPTTQAIDVAFTVQAVSGYDKPTVQANATAAIANYLSPANWGLPQVGDPGASGGWIQQTTIRYLELAQVLNTVDGVDYVVSLTFAKATQTKATADVVMTGAAPLPSPGTITGTVQ